MFYTIGLNVMDPRESKSNVLEVLRRCRADLWFGVWT